MDFYPTLTSEGFEYLNSRNYQTNRNQLGNSTGLYFDFYDAMNQFERIKIIRNGWNAHTIQFQLNYRFGHKLSAGVVIAAAISAGYRYRISGGSAYFNVSTISLKKYINAWP
jgi:hypothetical protein